MKNKFKRLFATAFCLFFAFSLFSCDQAEQPDTSLSVTSTNGDDRYADASVNIYTIHPFWHIASYKTISGKVAAELTRMFAGLPLTGNKLPALASEEPAEGAWNIDYMYFEALNYDANDISGTMWIETGEKLYRIDLNGTSSVLTPLGEGEELAADDKVKRTIGAVLSYWPYDTYKVSVGPNMSPGEPEHLYAAESDISVTVKSVRIKDESDGIYDMVGILAFTITSETDKSVHCTLTCHQSDDNLGSEHSVTVDLSAGKPQDVEIEFEPYGRGFLPNLFVDNIRVIIDLKE